MISKRSTNSSESSIKYFIIQAISSLIFISARLIMIYSSSLFFSNQINYLISIAIAIKIGAAPFHFWFPQIVGICSWPVSLFIITWQKVAPIFIIAFSQTKIIFLVVIISALTGAIGGLNQLRLKKIMAYSSIAHLAWLIMALSLNMIIWLVYFTVYTIIASGIIIIFFFLNINYINDLSKQQLHRPLKIILAFNIFSIAGLPPFLGFLIKIIVIDYILINELFFLTIFLIVSSIISLYFYSRINYSLIFLSLTPIKIKSTFKNKIPSTLPIISILLNCAAPIIYTLY